VHYIQHSTHSLPDIKLLRWMQNFHHSTWDYEILYTDRSSEGEQI
jgi:hypothetical protein